MPLSWDISQVDDYKSLYTWRDKDAAGWQGEGYYLWPKAEALIFALGVLGCGSAVTEDNYGEIAVRLDMYESENGALCYGPNGEDAAFTLADVKRLIGLTTNHGSRNEKRATWKNRVLAKEEVSA